MKTSKRIWPSFLAIIALASLLSACGKKEEDEPMAEPAAIKVEAKKVEECRVLAERLEFPATVASDQEAKIVARTSGNAKGVKFKVGDKVKPGDILVLIDDGKNAGLGSGVNTSQVRQAQIAAEQAAASYRLAESNYQNLLVTSAKDIDQARIGRDQALAGQSNLGLTTAESVKAAELALRVAQTAAQTAKQNYENRLKLSGLNNSDTSVNAVTSAESAANTAASIIVNINNSFGFDTTKGLSISYKKNLGALNQASLTSADSAYQAAETERLRYLSARFPGAPEKIEAAGMLVGKVKDLVSAVKTLLDNTITSVELPQSSAAGPSLNGFIAAIAGYQGQISAAEGQVNGAKQALASVPLSNDAALDGLKNAWELADKQVEQARQNLAGLKAGNKSQSDQAVIGVRSADNQLKSLQAKLDSQIDVSRSQAELARLQYQNALTALSGLYDIHQAVTPIEGTVTSKNIADGETVSPGQVLATVSRMDRIVLKIFVDESSLDVIKAGAKADIKDSEGKLQPGRIVSITPAADSLTKRFLVEVGPEKAQADGFILGTIMDVVVPVEKKAKGEGTLILPLSAVDVSQNESAIFIIEDGRAKKLAVKIEKVEGESAEVKADLPAGTVVITGGNKMIKEGDKVEAEKREE